MYSNHRESYRQFFFDVWQKHQKKLPLQAIEILILDIILEHPEYHGLLDQANSQTQEFSLEENPFFHMSLHLSLREQLKTNRPLGIKLIYDSLSTKYETQLEVEHAMMTCLANQLWQAQRTGNPPSEEEYLKELNRL